MSKAFDDLEKATVYREKPDVTVFTHDGRQYSLGEQITTPLKKDDTTVIVGIDDNDQVVSIQVDEANLKYIKYKGVMYESVNEFMAILGEYLGIKKIDTKVFCKHTYSWVDVNDVGCANSTCGVQAVNKKCVDVCSNAKVYRLDKFDIAEYRMSNFETFTNSVVFAYPNNILRDQVNN